MYQQFASTRALPRSQAREFVEAKNRKIGRILESKAGVHNPRLPQQLLDMLTNKSGSIFKWALDCMANSGGAAAGPDGIEPRDLSQSERWQIARSLQWRISRGKYRPGPHRTAKIPKGRHRGAREIQIQNVEDRAVQRAILMIVQPVIDRTLAPCSFGFRPRVDRMHALATALAIATRDNAWVWIVADIKDAFEQTDHTRLLNNLERRLPCPEIRDLIARVIEVKAPKGLAQGGSLSPLLLNVDLDEVLDRPWRQQRGDASLLRYADDLLLLNGDQKTADRDLSHLSRRLSEAGTPLKASPGTTIRDLTTGKSAEWLGFTIRRQGDTLDVAVSEAYWSRLDQDLEGCHDTVNPPQAALEVIQGHIDQLGPVYHQERLLPYCTRIKQAANRYGFEEIPTENELRTHWGRSAVRWDSIRTVRTDKLMIDFPAAPPAHFAHAQA
jgi:retron-type reverse transcriptase